MKKITALFLISALTGCTGQLYTIINPSELTPEYKKDKDEKFVLDANGKKIPIEKKIKGVIAYPQFDVIEVYKTTALTDKEGNIVNVKCTPKITQKFSKRVDYNHPYIMRYEHGLLETYKFAATLKNGALVSVNTESAPYDAIGKLKDILPYIKSTKDAELEFTKGMIKYCDAQPMLEGVYKHVEIKDASKMPNPN